VSDPAFPHTPCLCDDCIQKLRPREYGRLRFKTSLNADKRTRGHDCKVTLLRPDGTEEDYSLRVKRFIVECDGRGELISANVMLMDVELDIESNAFMVDE
jgi:hypothetical protein